MTGVLPSLHSAMRHESNVKGLAFMEAILLPVPSWEMFDPDLQSDIRAFGLLMWAGT